MNAIVTLALTLLQTIAPQLGGANAVLITRIIDGLIAIIPVLVKEYQDAVPFVKNVIVLLKNHNQVTADQLTQLDAMEAQIDADFEAIAAKVTAEDDAPKV